MYKQEYFPYFPRHIVSRRLSFASTGCLFASRYLVFKKKKKKGWVGRGGGGGGVNGLTPLCVDISDGVRNMVRRPQCTNLRVTVDNSGLCCCACLTSLER